MVMYLLGLVHLTTTGFTLTASYFLFACAKEKVTKEKAHPASGFRYAKLPSLRCRSGGRHEGTSLSLRSSLGVLPRVPLRNTSTRPPDGDSGSEVLGGFSWRYARCALIVPTRSVGTICY
mgnify:CR=1 FL=1